MRIEDAYKLLGVKEGSSIEEIKKAYKKLAMQHHPDKNPGDKKSEELFKQINEAHQVLTKPNTSNQSNGEFRGGVEDVLREFAARFGFGEHGSSGFSFNSGGGPRTRLTKRNRPGMDPIKLGAVDVGVISVSMSEAILREEVSLKLQVQAVCHDCLSNTSMWFPCVECGQKGASIQQQKTPFGIIAETSKCPFCSGKGWKKKSYCKTCKDQIIYKKPKTIKFRLPAEFYTGEKMRLSGAGNESWKTDNGDVIMSIRLDISNGSNLTIAEKEQLKKLLEKCK